MKKYADKTSIERSVERWENEGGEVLPTELRNAERAAIEQQENKCAGKQNSGEVNAEETQQTSNGKSAGQE